MGLAWSGDDTREQGATGHRRIFAGIGGRDLRINLSERELKGSCTLFRRGASELHGGFLALVLRSGDFRIARVGIRGLICEPLDKPSSLLRQAFGSRRLIGRQTAVDAL